MVFGGGVIGNMTDFISVDLGSIPSPQPSCLNCERFFMSSDVPGGDREMNEEEYAKYLEIIGLLGKIGQAIEDYHECYDNDDLVGLMDKNADIIAMIKQYRIDFQDLWGVPANDSFEWNYVD